MKDIGEVVAGGTPDTKNKDYWNGDIYWLTPADLSDYKNKYITKGSRNISKEGLKHSSAQLINANSVLYTSRAPIGYCVINNEPISTNQGFKSLDNFKKEMTEYIYYYLKFFTPYIVENASGTTFKEISGSRFAQIFFAFPPLSEQQRIVKKIEELFAQVDKIEKEKQSLLKLIDRAKEKVLDLAMKGKLVKQDPNDEPASVLLEKIFEEKKKLAKEGKIKLSKDELLPPQISDDNDYYQDLPENWALTKLKHIGIWGAGSTPIRKIKEYYNGNIPWLKTGELNNNIIFDSEEKITEKALKECNLKQNKIGNVLIAMYGATIGKLGIAGIELTTNQACCGCQPFIFNKYLFYFLMSIKNDLISQGSGGAQPNISKNIIVNNFIALPPLIEQKKIVSTLEILLNSLDQIKDSL